MKIAKYVKSEIGGYPEINQLMKMWLPLINKEHGKEFKFVEFVESGDLPQAKKVLEEENMILRYAIFETISNA